MKIALVSPYDLAYPGGGGRHVNGLAHQFRSLGHQVVIIAPSSGDDERDGHQRVRRKSLGHGLREALAVDGQSAPGGHLMSVASRHDQ